MHLTEEQTQALDRLIEYCWRDELEDYRSCEAENENARSGHIFESLVALDNALRSTNLSPADHLQETI